MKLVLKYKSLVSLGITLGLVGLATPRAAGAQGREKGDVPANSRPPAGMCRIWLDSVPAAQQPAPTDCASAVRNRPAKGRVIYGDDYTTKSKKPDSSTGTKSTTGTSTKTPGQAIRGFAPTKTVTKKPPLSIP